MNKPCTINSLLDIADQVDTFFLDMFGVLWDGEQFYPQALTACQQLMQQHKKVYILTNTTMGAAEFRQQYLPFNLIPGVHYTDVLTSGDVLQDQLDHHAVLDKITSSKSGKYFVIGLPNNVAFHNFVSRQASKISEAKAIYFGASQIKQGNKYVRLETLDIFLPQLEQGLALNLPAICANPDYFAFVGQKKCLTQGSLGKWYEDHGGKVYWFGKPYADIYDYALKKSSMPANKCAMIGDTIRTDIRGGTQAGMKTVLITGYGITHDRLQNGETLEQIAKQEKALPDFLLSIVR